MSGLKADVLAYVKTQKTYEYFLFLMEQCGEYLDEAFNIAGVNLAKPKLPIPLKLDQLGALSQRLLYDWLERKLNIDVADGTLSDLEISQALKEIGK